jgi:hypothetical protein
MKMMIPVLAAFALAILPGCGTGQVRLGHLNSEEKANFARGNRDCDMAGADAARDPSSPCYLAGRRPGDGSDRR